MLRIRMRDGTVFPLDSDSPLLVKAGGDELVEIDLKDVQEIEVYPKGMAQLDGKSPILASLKGAVAGEEHEVRALRAEVGLSDSILHITVILGLNAAYEVGEKLSQRRVERFAGLPEGLKPPIG